ncbi:ABC transporter ATP-binding protein [Pelagibacterium halotolerans]|uniref:ABC transporter ATP-binding protein n=1 Tax=Pelagibacterium halotolerans TaxID=531813 RepID=UPI00384AF01B
MQALDGVSLSLDAGKVLAMVGANGAGKSTLLRLLCGLVPRWSGRAEINGHQLKAGDPLTSASLGLALVPEGRLLFESLSVEENLMIGRGHRDGPWTLETIYTLFPILKEKRRQRPSTLSGGQQQMVAIGRALASNPAILLCDEISLGLSPRVTMEVYAALDRVRAEGVSLIIVDQDVERVCAHADDVVCLFKGRISHRGSADGVTADSLKSAYFGVAA